MGLGPVLAHGDLPEGWLELQRGVYEDAVGEGDARAAGGGPIGEHELHHLLGERVEALGGAGPVASQGGGELVAGGAPGAGGEEAERDVEGERGEGGVSGGGGGGGERGGEAEREAGLVRDGEADVGGGHGRSVGWAHLDGTRGSPERKVED